MDTTSEIRLQPLNPTLAAKIRLMDAEFQRQTDGDHLEVVQGLRSYADQSALYAKGRTAPGEIVTQAPGGHSWHEFAMAGDLVPRSLLPIPGWNPDSPLWPMITKIAESYGLVCGSCWHHHDLPHVQMTKDVFPVSPDDTIRTIYASGGLFAVWAEFDRRIGATGW